MKPGDAERDAARAMATQAMDLMREQRFEEAEQLLEQSYDVFPAPTIGVLRGDALVRLGRLRDAERVFTEVAHGGIDPDASPAFQQAVDIARRRLPELDRRIPRLTIVVNGASANEAVRVALNGEPQEPALLGIERRVDPGSYELVVREPSGIAEQRAFVLEEGKSERIAVDLEPVGAAPAPLVTGREPEPTSTPFTLRNVGWVTLGVGAAGLTTGIVAGAVMSTKNRQLVDACNPGCPERVADDIDTFETARTVSLVGFGVGVAATSVGATFILVGGAKEKAGVAPFVTGRVAGLRGRF